MNSRTWSSAPLEVDNSGRPKQLFLAYYTLVTRQVGTSYAQLPASTSTGRPVAQAELPFRYRSFFTAVERVTVANLTGLPMRPALRKPYLSDGSIRTRCSWFWNRCSRSAPPLGAM
jgi:hypothetical protein